MLKILLLFFGFWFVTTVVLAVLTVLKAIEDWWLWDSLKGKINCLITVLMACTAPPLIVAIVIMIMLYLI